METLKEHIKEYLAYGRDRKKLDEKTLKAYRIDLGQYRDFCGASQDCLTREELEAFITRLHQLYSPKTAKRKTASLKAFFRWLTYREIIETDPFTKIDTRFREPKTLPKTIPSHTIQAFLQELYRQKAQAKTKFQLGCCLRDIAVIELLFATGMRISELCALKPSDIDLEEKTVLIYGKGDRERIMQLGNRDVLEALSAYMDAFRDSIKKSGFLFINRNGNMLETQSVRNMINKYTKDAGISQHLTPHMFRHSFATLLLEQNVDIRYIQRMLGHSSISTTEIYTHVSNTKQREILESRHPRNQMKIS